MAERDLADAAQQLHDFHEQLGEALSQSRSLSPSLCLSPRLSLSLSLSWQLSLQVIVSPVVGHAGQRRVDHAERCCQACE